MRPSAGSSLSPRDEGADVPANGIEPRAPGPLHDAGMPATLPAREPASTHGPRSTASLIGPAALPGNDDPDDDSTSQHPPSRATSVIRRASRSSTDTEPAEPAVAPEPAATEPEPAAPEPAATDVRAEPTDAAEPVAPEPPTEPVAAEPAAPSRSEVPAPPPSLGELRMLADPTQRPIGLVTAVTDPPPAQHTPAKPLLASEALMEDLAPVEPAARDARMWCGACGISFLLFGLLPIVGLLPGALGSALPWLITGAISLVAAVSRVGYRQRAVAMLVLGLLSGFVALQGSATLVRADGGAGWGVSRLLSVVTLTAALLFRARYRAYAGARIFLGTALVVSLPFATHAGAVFASDAGFGPAHVGSALVLVTMAATLIGFMGAETIGAGPYVAIALVFAVALELASRGFAVVGLTGGLPPLVGVTVGAAGFGAAAGFTALGLFQLLAWRFAEDARRIDIHSPPRDHSPPSEHDPSSEWPS